MLQVKLNSGIEMPMLGYGVYQVTPQECERCVLDALALGYRHIDTAQAYNNEREVGNAVKKSGIDRKEIFITSKVWISNFGYEKTMASVEESLRKLQTDYIDLMLLHQPFGDVYGAWRALEELVQMGKVRAIGISNFYVDRFVEFCQFACGDWTKPDGTIVKGILPAVNQIEIHPYHIQSTQIEWMKKYNVTPEAWAPLDEGRDNIFNDKTLLAIAQKYSKSLHQIVLRWHMQRGQLTFPMSRNKAHMAENLNIFDFTLTDEDMKAIDSLDKGKSSFFSHQDPSIVEWFHQMA